MNKLQRGDQADGQQPQLGLWPLPFVFAQPEGFRMKSQACLQGVQGVGAELEDQPRKRLIREKPETLTVPLAINQV